MAAASKGKTTDSSRIKQGGQDQILRPLSLLLPGCMPGGYRGLGQVAQTRHYAWSLPAARKQVDLEEAKICQMRVIRSNGDEQEDSETEEGYLSMKKCSA